MIVRSQPSRRYFVVASIVFVAILILAADPRAQARWGGRAGGRGAGRGGFQGFGGDGFAVGNMNRANSYARGGYGSQRQFNTPARSQQYQPRTQSGSPVGGQFSEQSSANRQARYNQFNSQQQAKYNQLNTMQANRHNYKLQQQNQRVATVNANIGESNWNGGDGDDSSGEALGAAALGVAGGMAIGSRMNAPPAQNPYPPRRPHTGIMLRRLRQQVP